MLAEKKKGKTVCIIHWIRCILALSMAVSLDYIEKYVLKIDVIDCTNSFIEIAYFDMFITQVVQKIDSDRVSILRKTRLTKPTAHVLQTTGCNSMTGIYIFILYIFEWGNVPWTGYKSLSLLCIKPSVDHLNVKMPSYRCRDSHHKDKTVWWLSHLYNGSPCTKKNRKVLKRGPGFWVYIYSICFIAA